MADFFGLELVELAGSDRLFRKLLTGEWDDEFIIVEPGHRITPGIAATQFDAPVASCQVRRG